MAQPLSHSAPPRPLLERRLIVVTGKGGTGKTTVTAALAWGAASRGLRVCVVETGRDEEVPGLFGEAEPPVGYEGRWLDCGANVMKMEPYAALAEYLQLQLRIPGLVTRLLDQPSFHALLDAAPGWRELITLGKVWHLLQPPQSSDDHIDLLIVDAPATGHGLTFLDVPRVVVSAVRAGPLQRHASWVEDMVRDPTRTLLLPVTLPEELPVRETLELVARARAEVGIAIDRVVINATEPDPLPPELPDLAQRLAALPTSPVGLPAPSTLAHCVAHRHARASLQREAIAELRAGTDLPFVALPRLDIDADGPAALNTLATALQRPVEPLR
ncbi:MAG: ArsA family ATPase [bacterium]|nr:ArsA family ATPase [bacterium]MCP5070450.1 ArsA family ATPase [bacterium]